LEKNDGEEINRA